MQLAADIPHRDARRPRWWRRGGSQGDARPVEVAEAPLRWRPGNQRFRPVRPPDDGASRVWWQNRGQRPCPTYRIREL